MVGPYSVKAALKANFQAAIGQISDCLNSSVFKNSIRVLENRREGLP